MTTDTEPRAAVTHAIELAGRAPSIHNTQPWTFDVWPDRVDVRADLRRWLPATDADGRDLHLSCGAAIHHLRVALADAGIATRVTHLPDRTDPQLLASVFLGSGVLCDRELAGAIPRRRTDRRRFRRWPRPAGLLTLLVDKAADQGAVLRPVEDAQHREALVAAFAEAARLQAGSPGYAHELGRWTGGERTTEGVPSSSLPAQPAAGTGGPAARFDNGEWELPADQSEEWATLLVLGTASDDALSQLRAGEAMSAVLLQATAEGLATAPLSQPLEVGATRRILQEEVLDGTLCPQALFRVGWAADDTAPQPTPRRPVTETTRFAS